MKPNILWVIENYILTSWHVIFAVALGLFFGIPYVIPAYALLWITALFTCLSLLLIKYINNVMKLKDIKKPENRNFVAKNMGINKASTHKDKKKALKRNPRKNVKHKGRMYESFEALFEESKVWTKEEIRDKLKTDDRWLARALVAIYDKQTEDEQANLATSHANNVGFSGVDAEFLSSVAQFYKRKGFMSGPQLKHVRKKMLKYSGQLAKIANGKI